MVCRWARIAEERKYEKGEDCAGEDCDEDAVHYEKGNPAAGNVHGEVWVLVGFSKMPNLKSVDAIFWKSVFLEFGVLLISDEKPGELVFMSPFVGRG